MRDDCWIAKVAFVLWIPVDLIWGWITEIKDDRDIEEQRRRLEALARKANQ
jgi:hypothetical protein